MKAAELWNKSKSEGGDDLLALPTSKHTSSAASFTDSDLAARIADLELKAKTDTDPNIGFEILYLKQEQEQRKKVSGA